MVLAGRLRVEFRRRAWNGVERMSGWFPLPSGTTERLVKAGDLTMKVVEAGEGPAVLLIHGLGWDHSLWNPTVEQFSPRYRMIAVDTRGHGGTDKPAGPYDMATFARDYAALWRMRSVSSASASSGCRRAAWWRRSWPCCDPTWSRRWVLISTSCKSAPSLRDNMEARIAATGSGRARGRREDRRREHLLARVARGERRRTGAVLRVALGDADGAAQRRDPGALRLRSVERPAVHQRADAGRRRRRGRARTRPAGMEEIAALIPGAKYQLVPGSGHMLPVEQPAAVFSLAAGLSPGARALKSRFQKGRR